MRQPPLQQHSTYNPEATTGFGKTHRLLNAAQYQSVFDNVDHKQGGSFFTFLSKKQTISQTNAPALANKPRLGIIISKRNVPTAVGRNYLKRIIRETFRQNVLSRSEIPGFDVIVLAKPSCRDVHKDGIEKDKVFRGLEQQWQKLLNKILQSD